MKKRLLCPPEKDREILFFTRHENVFPDLGSHPRIGTAHQPCFFHPGICLKYLFLHALENGEKQFLFLDTDMIRSAIRVPSKEEVQRIELLRSDRVLSFITTPEKDDFDRFFGEIFAALRTAPSEVTDAVTPSIEKFRNILYSHTGEHYFKDVLVKSFLDYWGLPVTYSFLSDILAKERYRSFVRMVCERGDEFRNVFNRALDEYSREFRFRYRNFPFPKLEEGELPFWRIEKGVKHRLFSDKCSAVDTGELLLYPRAVTLTLYLRLYEVDVFIHGIGGANYEWIQDRLFEQFFDKKPTPYTVISGTFFIKGLEGRDYPYFFYNPDEIKSEVMSHKETLEKMKR